MKEKNDGKNKRVERILFKRKEVHSKMKPTELERRIKYHKDALNVSKIKLRSKVSITYEEYHEQKIFSLNMGATLKAKEIFEDLDKYRYIEDDNTIIMFGCYRNFKKKHLQTTFI